MKTTDVQCGEWRVHYTVQGEGPALILLHGGAPGSQGRESFARNIPALALHFRTHVIDFPGWGQSSSNLMPEGQWVNPLERAGDVIVAFIRALSLGKAHLLGGSFGGGAALYAALKQPALIDRLVLAAPAGGEHSGPPAPGLLKLLTYYAGEGPTRAKYEDLLAHCVRDTSILSPAWVEERFAPTADPAYAQTFPLRLPPGGLASLASLKPVCQDPALASLRSPVLFVWGQQDRMQPIAALPSFRAIPNQRSLVWDDCGHWPYWEHADRFNAEVLQFLLAPQNTHPETPRAAH